MIPRYAVYYAPARHSPWWQFAAYWLGRDETTGMALTHPSIEGLDAAAIAALTQTPRRYGFHATLKAPFRLAGGVDEHALVARLQQLAATLKPVKLVPLRLAALGDFVALVPEGAGQALQAIAADCVTKLDDLRAPLEPADMSRRNPSLLDAREAELLTQYGYPYVMERFRFHMTLTRAVNPAQAQRVVQALETDIARLNREAPLALDRLCVFVEPSPGAEFRRIADVSLGA